MSALLDLLTQFTATYLARKPLPPGAFIPQRVHFTPDGVDVEGTVDHPQASGPAALRLTVQERAPGRFALHVAPRQLPDRLAPEVAAYRDVLERLRVQVDLDFSGGPVDGSG